MEIGRFFHEYLWIDQFVWAPAFYGLRMGYCASFDCSGVSQKIHMRKIEVGQGPAHDAQLTEARVLDAPGLARTRHDSQGALWVLPGRARSHQDARRCHGSGSKNLFQRAILYRHEKMMI